MALNYSGGEVPPAKVSFAVQAAQFAFWAPIASLIVGCGANAALNKPGGGAPDPMTGTAWMVIGGVNVLLNLAALVLGIVAVIGVWRHKLKGILLRAMVGITISSLVLAAAAYMPFLVRSIPETMARRLEGNWHAVLHPPGGTQVEITMGLGHDKRVEAEFNANGRSVKMKGDWRVLFGGAAGSKLQVKWDAGQEQGLGAGIQWTIERIDEDQVVLVGANPDGSPSREIFQRVKK